MVALAAVACVALLILLVVVEAFVILGLSARAELLQRELGKVARRRI